MPQPARRPARPVPRRRPAGAAVRPSRPRPAAGRIMGALAVAVLTTSGLAHLAMGGLNDHLARVDAFGGLDDRPPHRAGENFLLVGTDGRDRVGAADRERYRLGRTACRCADTVMLAHLSADRRRLAVVGIPRDTYVRLPIAGHRDRPAKLNAAYSGGGPRLTVRTVERLTGVHIDHYLELDFTDFTRSVDAVGGVPVCTALPLRDPVSGLDLPAGRTLLSGGRALEYVRARHLDGSADLGRMRRQQRFLAAFLHRAAGSSALLDPVALTRTAGAALDSLRTDRSLRPADLVRLGETLRALKPSAIQFATVPVEPVGRRVPGAGTAVTWAPGAAALFAAIRGDRPLPAARPERSRGAQVPADPGRIRVQVTGADQAAVRRTERALRGTGFAVGPARGGAGAPVPARDGARTVIAYDPRAERSARSLAAALPSAVLRPVPRLGTALRVTLGGGRTAVLPVRYSPIAGTGGRGAEAGAVSGAEELCR